MTTRGEQDDQTNEDRVTQGTAQLAEPQNASLAPDQAAMNACIYSVAKARDKDAFAQLFQHYAPRIKAYMLGMDKNHALAEELAQEAMLQVWRKADLFDGNKASASTWIFTIARNLRIDRIRHESHPEYDPHDPMLVPDPPQSSDDSVAQSQIQLRMRQSIDRLPPEQSEIIRLSFFDGLSHGAIAEHLGIPLGTVKSRLRLAFTHLRKTVGELR